MSEEPQDPLLEVKMAAAGPLMSFLIAGVLAGAWYCVKDSELTLVNRGHRWLRRTHQRSPRCFQSYTRFPIRRRTCLARQPLETLS